MLKSNKFRDIIIMLGAVLLLAGLAAYLIYFSGTKDKTFGQSGTYEISCELLHLLWDVDHETFDEAPMIEFVSAHFESSYKEYFLEDPQANAGVAHAKDTKLVTRLLETVDTGLEQTGDEWVQSVRATAYVEQFEPEDAEEFLYKQGETYQLNYEIHFTKEEEMLYITSFLYEMEQEGEGDATTVDLTEQERTNMMEIAKEYLFARYMVDWETFDAEALWAFYTEYAMESFLTYDGITQESLVALEEEYRTYHVDVTLLSYTIDADSERVTVYNGFEDIDYFCVRAAYTYEIEADENFFSERGISSTIYMEEMIYFELSSENRLQIVFATYQTES